MYCSNCGKELNEGALYCDACGTKVDPPAEDIFELTTEPSPEELKAEEPEDIYSGYEAGEQERTFNPLKAFNFNINKKLLAKIGTVVLAVVIVVTVPFILYSFNHVNAGNFINDELRYNGFNGYANADIDSVYNYERLQSSLTKSNGSADNGFSIKDYVMVTADKITDLRNNDVVSVLVIPDYNAINSLGFSKKLVGKKEYRVKYKVENLKDPVTVNPFDIISGASYNKRTSQAGLCYYNEVTVDDTGYKIKSGLGPEVEIVDSKGKTLCTFGFLSEYNSSSKNVKVTAIVTDESQFANNGVIITPLESEYVPSYSSALSNVESVNVDDYQFLQKCAEAKAKEDGGNAVLSSSYFFINRKPDSSIINAIVFLFKITDANNGSEIYRPYLFYNIDVDDNNRVFNMHNLVPTVGSVFNNVNDFTDYYLRIYDIKQNTIIKK